MKSEFVYAGNIYKEVDKETVIFYIEAGYNIFVIIKDLQREILKQTKHFEDIVSFGMLFISKEDGYDEFLDSMQHYFNNNGIPQGSYTKCYYYILRPIGEVDLYAF